MRPAFNLVAMLLLSTLATPTRAEIVGYVSSLTEDSIVRLQDLNNDGDVHDAGEATQFFGPGNADGWPGVGSAQTILVLGPDHVLAGDGEESGAFETRVYRLRDLNGDGDAMDLGEATEFWNSILPLGVNFDRPKDMTIGPDGAIYLADNNTINFDNDTPEAVWRLEDLNADGDVNDAGEVTLYKELAPAGDAFAFISEDFKWNSAGQLVFSNQDSSSNRGTVWFIEPDLSLTQFASDTDDLLGLVLEKPGMTLHPLSENPVFAAADIADNRRVVELIDYNGNGRIDDNSETLSRYRSDVAAEPFLWSLPNRVMDVDYAPDGALWLLNMQDDVIYRFVDLTGDGDYLDSGEAAILYDADVAAPSGAFVMDFPRTVGFATRVIGDLNCDGAVNAADIDPFVLALTDPPGYELLYPTCSRWLGDVNADGAFNAGDIDPFVVLLVGP